jgi:hypothetical protein
VRCTGLNPDCALIYDEAKDTGAVNGITEILGTSNLAPGDSQITAAVDSISIAASSNIDTDKNAPRKIKMIYYGTLEVSNGGTM